MNSKSTDIIILGAGLTGLTLGYYLNKSGKKICIVEKENRPGGVINTVTADGFTYETGPSTGVLSSPEIAQLFEDLKDKCTLEVADKGAKKRYILKDNKWEPLPSGLFSAITTPLFTLKDKFRILGEPFRKPGTDPDESVAQLVIRRMGQSFLDYAVNPFVSGVYAGDPERLITRYALPKLYALEQTYGSFIKGAIAKGKEKKTEAEKKATKEVFSVKGGLASLINALAEETGKDNILTGCKNITVRHEKSGFKLSYTDTSGQVNEISAPVVITTIGAYALPEVLPFIPQEKMKDISSLTYGGVVQVSVGYKKWTGNKLDAFGGLVPAVEKKNILGILFPSAIFKGKAPEGGALLSVFLGGIKNPAILKKNDGEITRIVLKDIADTLAERGIPDLLKIHRHQHAIPQYEKSSGIRLETISSLEREFPGLILAGNIRDGIGMADRVKQARNLALQLVK